MLPDQAALCKQATMLEAMKLKETKFHPAFMMKLETLLLDVYAGLLPSVSEYEQRKQLVQAFNMIAKKIFGDNGDFSGVVAFGSFVMDIFTAKSDLDLSINFSSNNDARLPRVQVVTVLRRFAKVLREERNKGHLSKVSLVQHAKVPVLKAVDCKTGIECDISVENKDGISRSLFYSIILLVDERFRIMSYLAKAWAKANNINSSRRQTMNSVTIISLVALHFQTRDPPILPPFSTLLRDGTDITNLPNVVPELKELAKRNTESVAELFVSLLAKLTSVEKLWELGLCASNFEGSWISKTLNSKVSNVMNVEDFQDRTQNFARSVGKSKMPKIYNCLRDSLRYLSSSMMGEIEISELRTHLFLSADNSARLIIKTKLPIKSIQPFVDTITVNSNVTANTGIVNKNNYASLKRKKTSTSSALLSVIAPTNPTSIHNGMSQKPRPFYPNVPIQYNASDFTLKRPRHDSNASGTLPFGSHENQSYMFFPIPMMYPTPSYVPPLNGIGHPNILAYQPLLPSNMGHRSYQHIQRPFINQLPLSSHLQPPLEYGQPVLEASRMLQYFPNPVHPTSLEVGHPSMFPGYAMHNSNNVGQPQYFVPPRSFGSSHP